MSEEIYKMTIYDGGRVVFNMTGLRSVVTAVAQAAFTEAMELLRTGEMKGPYAIIGPVPLDWEPGDPL